MTGTTGTSLLKKEDLVFWGIFNRVCGISKRLQKIEHYIHTLIPDNISFLSLLLWCCCYPSTDTFIHINRHESCHNLEWDVTRTEGDFVRRTEYGFWEGE